MRDSTRPSLDPRQADAFVEEVVRRIPGFVRGWRPGASDPGRALIEAYGHLMEAFASRLNEAPDKNKLAFYDALGASLLPASSARAPFVFQAIPQLADSVIPTRTRVGAAAPNGSPETVVFETDSGLELASSPLAEVVGVWPGRDAVSDHSEDLARGQPFTLFQSPEGIRHELYLGHERDLAIVGPCAIEVEVRLATPASRPLPLAWEYWDGVIWRRFKPFEEAAVAGPRDSLDGTRGLTRSGTIVLAADCARGERVRVHSAECHWIRARVSEPLVADDAGLPAIDAVRLAVRLDRSLPLAPCPAIPEEVGIFPDHGYLDDQKLDLTKAVEPLGARPRLGTALCLASEEVFAKPGAQVTLCFAKVVTPEEKADEEGAKFEVDVENVADHIVGAARQVEDTVRDLVDAAQDLATAQPIDLSDLLSDVADARNALTTEGMWGVEDLDEAVHELVLRFSQIPPQGWQVGTQHPFGLPWDFISPVPTDEDDIVDSILGFQTHNEARMQDAFEGIRQASTDARDVLDLLEELTPYGAALAAGATLPAVGDPKIVWEYFDGLRWKGLGVDGLPGALNLTEGGPVTFTVPADLDTGEVAGVEGRWIRARLVEGGYGIVRLIAWNDETTGKTNFFPIVEYRPPVVEKVKLGYVYRSPKEVPEHCLALNNSLFVDRHVEITTDGRAFMPFEAAPEPTPSLYLGFAGRLPEGALGIFVDVEERIGEDTGPALAWEGWDGAEWIELAVRDETQHLAVPGIVTIIWPGARIAAEADLLRTQGAEVHLAGPAEAARFVPGDRVYVSSGDTGELRTVLASAGSILTLKAPLEKDLTRGTIQVATLPRFGTPRTWIRARLAAAGPPRRVRIRGIHSNSAWGSQVQTYEDEIVGSSSGESDQVFFLRHAPVLPGAVVEVRELDGPRAEIEGPLLLRELTAEGRGADVRMVRDPRTKRISEVWVRWRERASLHFSAPDAREFVLEGSRGRLVFGGGARGRIPPVGRDNVRIRRYRSGGGASGNVGAGRANQAMSGVLAKSVTNTHAADGGAAGESPEMFLRRGPHLARHRRLAMSRQDYEDLALEASSAVAAARALPATHPSGRRAPGWVTIQIVPHSTEARPVPGFALRDTVRRFVQRRAPAAVVRRVSVIPADYFPVGVVAVVRATDARRAGALVDDAEIRLAAFFHPLTGGPDGRGWPFGRDVHLSDVARALGAIEGLDVVERLALVREGTPVASPVEVPADRIVVAGSIEVSLGLGSEANA